MQAPAQPVTAEAIPADVTRRVLRLLREDYDHVVIDTPSAFDDHVLGPLNSADVLVLPTLLVSRRSRIFDASIRGLRVDSLRR